MKPLTAIICLAVFASLSVFGFLAMLDAKTMVHGDCFAEILAKGIGVCLAGFENSLAAADFHINALKSFSTLTVNFGLVLALYFLAFSALFILPANFLFGASLLFGNLFLKRKTNFYKNFEIAWLSLHENSPSII